MSPLKKEYNMTNCGIDFGTTNSTLVFFSEESGKFYIGDSKRTGTPMPSIVAINKNNGEISVGSDVKDKLRTLENDCHIVLSIKTILNDEKKIWEAGDKKYTPVDVAAEILKVLKKTANTKQENISSAVISVPVNFEASKKKCLKKAAEKAGITVKKFISEPTAAFIAHYHELRAFSRVVVFDWGGGTLDISALEIKDGTIHEIYTDNLYKAGDNIDKEFARKIYEKVVREEGLKLIPFEHLSVAEYDELLEKTELAKISLSKKDNTKDLITIQEKNLKVTFSYQELQDVALPFVEEAIEKLSKVISFSFKNEVGCILCVGGSSKLRLLQEKLRPLFAPKLYFPDNPEWDIAEGACTVDAAPDDRGKYMLNNDIKIALSNGEWLTLLSKGQPIPTKERIVHLSTVDCMETANFVFKMGEHSEDMVTFPILGGIDEVITLSVYVDDFSVFHAIVKTNKDPTEYEVYACEKIDLCYHIED